MKVGVIVLILTGDKMFWLLDDIKDYVEFVKTLDKKTIVVIALWTIVMIEEMFMNKSQAPGAG